MYKFILAAMAAIAFSVPAFASSDWSNPDDDGLVPSTLCATSGAGTPAIRGNGVKPGSTKFHCATSSNTGDSPLIEVSRAATLTFDPDKDDTTGAARIYIRKCLQATKSANSCLRVIMDADASGVIDTSDVAGSLLDGDNGETANNGRFVFNLTRGYYYFEYQTDPGSGEDAIISLEGY